MSRRLTNAELKTIHDILRDCVENHRILSRLNDEPHNVGPKKFHAAKVNELTALAGKIALIGAVPQ